MDFRLNLASKSVGQTHPDEPLTVSSSTSVSDVFDLMQQRRRGSVLVCAPDGTLAGIFTERDAVKLMASSTALATPIDKVMVPNPTTVTNEDSVATAISAMARGGYRRLPVVDESGCPVGVLGVSHIVGYLVEHIPEVVYTLPPKTHRTSSDREGA